MSETLFLIIELIGTIAFAISGANLGIEKKMDIFGVTILGLTTAVGGGIIRDLTLGITPPTTFKDPIYALLAIITSILFFFPAIRKKLENHQHVYNHMMLCFDSLGLGAFTVVGIKTAFNVSDSFNIFLLIFVGVITGTGGGVIRDILAGTTPSILVRHFYACASIIGSIVCVAMWNFVGDVWAMILGMTVTFVLRILAAHYRWSLPKAK